MIEVECIRHCDGLHAIARMWPLAFAIVQWSIVAWALKKTIDDRKDR